MSKKLFSKVFILLLVVGLLFAVAPTGQAQAQTPTTLNVAKWGNNNSSLPAGGRPSVLYEGGTYHLWWGNENDGKLYYATSTDPGFEGAESEEVKFPDKNAPVEQTSVTVIQGEDKKFLMITYGESIKEFNLYSSNDGINWDFLHLILDATEVEIFTKIDAPFLLKEDKEHYNLYYQARDTDGNYNIYLAELLDLGGVISLGSEQKPVLEPETGETRVHHPTVVKDGSLYYMWYVTQNQQTIGLARSTNGVDWTKSLANPVLDDQTFGGFFAEPSVVKAGETWYLWFMSNPDPGEILFLSSPAPFECQTIQAAVNAAQNGDTILVSPGEFEEDVVVNNKYFNLLGTPNGVNGPTWLKGSLSINNPALAIDGSAFTTIKNIYFDRTDSHLLILQSFNGGLIENCLFDGNNTFANNGINLNNGGKGNSKITVKDSIFKDGLYVGIGGYANEVTVNGSTFTNVKSGINMQGNGNLVVTDSTFLTKPVSDGDSYGIRYTAGDITGAKSMTITGSTFEIDLSGGFTPASGNYHTSIYTRGTGLDTLTVERNTILGGAVNTSLSATLDVSPNWWGSALGPQFPIEGDVQIAKWCADADCLTFLPDDNGDVPIIGDPFTQTGAIKLYVDGVNYYLPAGTTIQNSSPCFEVYANDVMIYTDDPASATCVPTNGSDGIWVADGVENLRVVNLEFDGTGQTTGSGIFFAGDAVGFQVVDNHFHDLDVSGVVFTGTPSGSTMDIQGNMFRDLGAAAIVSPAAINAEFNSWGVYAGATLTNVDTEPHTHADFYMEYEGVIPLEKVAVGNTIKYTVYGNLQNISGADFTLKFPTAYLDAATPTNLSAFTSAGPAMFIVDDVAGTIRFQGASFTPITGENLPIFEVVFTGTAAGTGAISFDLTNDVFSMSPGYGPSTWVYAAGYVDRTVEVFVDSAAPTLTSWTPDEGDIYLAEGEDFVLTVDALDDNLFSLEIDHNVTALPEFTVYASATNVYGSTAAQNAFEAAGLIVTYDESTQTWTLTFNSAGSALAALLAKQDVVFYAVLHDQAGKTWGSMDPTEDFNTFAYSIVFDNTAPTLDSWTPAKDVTYMLTPSGDFVVTVDANDINLYELELDNSLEPGLPQFSVYADETDPYGGDGELFDAGGLEVTYYASTQTWVLTFENGGDALDAIIANQGITFYAVIHDLAGNTWGSMYTVTPDNTFAYTLYQQQPIARADSTGGEVVAVVSADGNTINFTGEVDWYPADPTLGRTSGHRIGVRLSAPELDFGTGDTTFTFNGQTYDWDIVKDGDDYVLVYPKVTAPIQSWEIVVTWGGGFSQTFTVNFNGTLGPVTAYTVDGEISMQGRVARNTEDVITLDGYELDDFTADSLDKLGINYTLSDVLTGEYTIVTNQPRYLNIYCNEDSTDAIPDFCKKITLISDRTLPTLWLRGGNAIWTDNEITLDDANKVGTDWGSDLNPDGNVNFDSIVNIQDLALVGGNYGLTSADAYGTWLP